MDYSTPSIYLPETISLALYPHNINTFVLIVPYFMWLWFYLNRTPGVFYTKFYKHTRRLRLAKPLYLELFRTSNGFF